MIAQALPEFRVPVQVQVLPEQVQVLPEQVQVLPEPERVQPEQAHRHRMPQ
jgi:hypothetical protein